MRVDMWQIYYVPQGWICDVPEEGIQDRIKFYNLIETHNEKGELIYRNGRGDIYMWRKKDA